MLSKILITIVHLILLGWIIYLLNEGGNLLTHEIALHFLGIGLMGVILIRGTAKFEMWMFLREKKKKHHK